MRRLLLILALLALPSSVLAQGTFTPNMPAAPQTVPDVSMPDLTGYLTKTVCASGCDFTSINTALNDPSVKNATPGAIVTCAAGQTFNEGTISLPAHAGPGWIILQSSAAANLPGLTTKPCGANNCAVKPTMTGNMCTIIGQWNDVNNNSGACVGCKQPAYYRLVGLEMTGALDGGPNNIWRTYGINGGESNSSVYEDHIVLDRVYVHNNGTGSTASCNGIAAIGSNWIVNQSYLSGFIVNPSCGEGHGYYHSMGGANNVGTILIKDNYIEGPSEPLLIGNGGSGPCATCQPMYDVTIHGNWTAITPGQLSQGKELVEIKACVRCLIEGNVFQKIRVGGQSGQAHAVKSGSFGTVDRCIGCFTSDIEERYNWFTDICGGIDIEYNNARSLPQVAPAPTRVWIHDNLFTNYGTTADGLCNTGARRALFLAGPAGVTDIIYDHNTWAVPNDPAGTLLGVDCEDTLFGAMAPFVDRITLRNNLYVSSSPTVGFPNAITTWGVQGLIGCAVNGTASYFISTNIVWGAPYAINPTGNGGCTGTDARQNGWFPDGSNNTCVTSGDNADFAGYVPRPFLHRAAATKIPAGTGVSIPAGPSGAIGQTQSLAYCLPNTSPYHNGGTDGRDVGWNCVAGSRLLKGVSSLY